MSPLADIRAIVFDLDGTLIDSLGDIVTHLNDALVDHGLPVRTDAEIGEWVGYGAEQLVARAVPGPALVQPVLARYRERYQARPVIATRLYAGLDRVLDQLADRHRFAVLTNKPHDLTLDVVATLLARWRFEVVSGQRPGHPHKPDPAALRAIAEALGTGLHACAMVGDSEVDIATARAAGAPSIGVSWGLRPLAVLAAAAPDHLVHTPGELGALFG